MTLFDKNGHLTDAALAALAEGSLCEAQRLAVAQHLAQCDDCLLRLTDLDEQQLPLLQPGRPVADAALQTLQKRRTIEFVRRCGIVAAAACFMFISWRVDLFGKLSEPPIQKPQLLQQVTAQFASGLAGWNDRLTQSMRDTLEFSAAADAAEQQIRSE